MSMVDTYLGPTEVHDRPYWHLASLMAGFFLHNVRCGKGMVWSVSAMCAADPELRNAQTPYSGTRLDDAKEAVFEEVRQAICPHCPPRMKSFYVFDERELAEQAIREWFSPEGKLMLECRVVVGATIHRVDTKWLNAPEKSWREHAERYWRGEMTSSPFPEVLIQGALYFPDWERFPVQD